jgi:hypothetical protein
MKINLKKLPISEKIELFNRLYEDISGKGVDNDTELAHVNKYEASVLRALGGSGTINPSTNLVQFMGGGGSSGGGGGGQSSHTTSTVQKNEIPEYFKPYALEMIETASQVYDQPYDAYTGQRLADVAPAQAAAYTGLEQFYSQVNPETGLREYYNPTEPGFAAANVLTGTGAQQFGDMSPTDFQERYMSPYQQAVTDVAVREAQRLGDAQGQQIAGEAGKAGAYGGSRHAIMQAEHQRNQARHLSDIQTAGSQKAFEAGTKAFDTDRAMALASGKQFGALAPAAATANLTGLGALQTLGETQRAMAQQPLDIGYEEFVRQRDYPAKQVQEYSGVVQGFPMQPSTYTTAQEFQQPPSLGSQLLSAASLYGGIQSGLGKGFFGDKEGGLISLAGGGPIGFQAGGPAKRVPLRGSRPVYGERIPVRAGGSRAAATAAADSAAINARRRAVIEGADRTSAIAEKKRRLKNERSKVGRVKDKVKGATGKAKKGLDRFRRSIYGDPNKGWWARAMVGDPDKKMPGKNLTGKQIDNISRKNVHSGTTIQDLQKTATKVGKGGAPTKIAKKAAKKLSKYGISQIGKAIAARGFLAPLMAANPITATLGIGFGLYSLYNLLSDDQKDKIAEEAPELIEDMETSERIPVDPMSPEGPPRTIVHDPEHNAEVEELRLAGLEPDSQVETNEVREGEMLERRQRPTGFTELVGEMNRAAPEAWQRKSGGPVGFAFGGLPNIADELKDKRQRAIKALRAASPKKRRKPSRSAAAQKRKLFNQLREVERERALTSGGLKYTAGSSLGELPKEERWNTKMAQLPQVKGWDRYSRGSPYKKMPNRAGEHLEGLPDYSTRYLPQAAGGGLMGLANGGPVRWQDYRESKDLPEDMPQNVVEQLIALDKQKPELKDPSIMDTDTSVDMLTDGGEYVTIRRVAGDPSKVFGIRGFGQNSAIENYENAVEDADEYNRILPYIRENARRAKAIELGELDPNDSEAQMISFRTYLKKDPNSKYGYSRRGNRGGWFSGMGETTTGYSDILPGRQFHQFPGTIGAKEWSQSRLLPNYIKKEKEKYEKNLKAIEDEKDEIINNYKKGVIDKEEAQKLMEEAAAAAEVEKRNQMREMMALTGMGMYGDGMGGRGAAKEQTGFDMEKAIPWFAMAARLQTPGQSLGEATTAAISDYTTLINQAREAARDDREEEARSLYNRALALGQIADAWADFNPSGGGLSHDQEMRGYATLYNHTKDEIAELKEDFKKANQYEQREEAAKIKKRLDILKAKLTTISMQWKQLMESRGLRRGIGYVPIQQPESV